MIIKTFFILILLQLFFTQADAQRVKRKGVDLIEVSSIKVAVNTPVFTIDKFFGKWQEVSRTNTFQSVQSFTDTFFVDFATAEEVTIKQKHHLTYKGDAVIVSPGNVLLLVSDVFTIVSVSENEMVLDNQENILHRFKKTSKFWYEAFGKKAGR